MRVVDVLQDTLPLLDVMDRPFAVGQTIVRPIPVNAGGSCALEVRIVSKIANGKLYLNGSHTPIKFPKSLAIITA
ncbi:hypothetical protein UFOVP116_297 [uncultured Caudovirales phage]|uniref:Uncharacterized protein n=1 Tax=uncultured Caudovirales phage TaxID=2100421 RepID=A0A6J5L816_9CAUD|nr:hypothetical protein UFOVP116_297 [uncultured Caudovirales phage]